MINEPVHHVRSSCIWS